MAPVAGQVKSTISREQLERDRTSRFSYRARSKLVLKGFYMGYTALPIALGVLLVGVLIIRVPLFGVYIRAHDV